MGIGILATILLLVQIPFVCLWLARLFQGPTRRSPLRPVRANPEQLGTVSVVVPTLNEEARIDPCLTGLSQQGYELREVIVVDSRSQDGTVDRVKAVQQTDPRFRVIYDDPLPSGWVGRPWALHTGFLNSAESSTWVLGIDADTQPQPGLIASVIQVAEQEHYDLISLSPRFILMDAGECWLQPALLMTLIYRFGPSGGAADGAERVMANGQCFLSRRSLLVELGGYTSARQSFCDDVTLARFAAAKGAKVGFLDGAKVLKVRMYEGMAETWREWGRSLDLKDACSPGQKWADLLFLTTVQALPLLTLPIWIGAIATGHSYTTVWAALGLNGVLMLIRVALLWAIAPSYDFSQARGAWTFWLSPLADPVAVFRILISSVQTPKQWRGRTYS
ncbi:MAG: glycosyltransferase [Synechococcales cyanobacterium T60_A2020_003]|nr:glycosyltransferase [Synechococcales cyanobacterium T60_A2020_003]